METIRHASLSSPSLNEWQSTTMITSYVVSLSYSRDVLPDQLRNRISEIQETYNKENWDGEGASPVSLQASMLAWEVLQQLQALIPGRVLPEDVTVANTGNIMIDIYKSKEKQALVTVTASSEIVFAYRYDGERIKGSCPVHKFKYESSLRTLLKRLN
jgi:hypothetical protein